MIYHKYTTFHVIFIRILRNHTLNSESQQTLQLQCKKKIVPNAVILRRVDQSVDLIIFDSMLVEEGYLYTLVVQKSYDNTKIGAYL